jgi:hypothetical protein
MFPVPDCRTERFQTLNQPGHVDRWMGSYQDVHMRLDHAYLEDIGPFLPGNGP